ncbi:MULTISPECIES: ABC transporter permease [Paenibacillus]|uniref:Multiple sugar transport system permease n=2 Tax=Paenibacillus barengoltzii TaxID=343517 RepID=R9L737_9BACL|nr:MULTISPECIES: ABC transporter permease subunit [Paenibacillus]EOS54363.1 multiple sugar transport system permease [Paenibacillus barengoltzii G22]MDU0332523.1 ABC transporter permease subunit [Paenibacillus sp. 3LSP]SMF25821.1 putative aldouronate transport system permease protein [Paenibacillus barengoltzii J12]
MAKSTASAKKPMRIRVKQFFIDFGRQWEIQSMIWPGIIFMIIFCYIPIYGLTIAFKNYTVIDTLSSAPWVGLDNFKIIATDKYFWESVVNTLGISFLKLAIGFVIPIILAIMIYEVGMGRFKKIVQTISYLPHFLSWIVLGGMLITWFSTTGMFNQLLLDLGLISKPQNILLDPGKYWWIAVLSDVWKEAGWGTILYLAIMAKIDPTYYEAAKIDGASRLRQIWNITLPNMRMIISLNLILTISGLLGSNLDQTLVLMNSQNRERAEVINSYVYRMGLTQGDFSYATAVGLGVSVVSVILLVLANKVTSKLNDNQSVL